MSVKTLTPIQSMEYLGRIGMTLDDWNRIEPLESATGAKGQRHWINHPAPNAARDLLILSYLLATWLPQSSWVLFQLDHSGGLDVAQASVCTRVLTLPIGADYSTVLFEFGDSENDNAETMLAIANLIFFLLLFQSHGAFVSSSSSNFECLSLQDGFVYFSAYEPTISGAHALVSKFAKGPELPEWVWRMDPRNAA